MHCCIEFIQRQSTIFGDICKLPAENILPELVYNYHQGHYIIYVDSIQMIEDRLQLQDSVIVLTFIVQI